MRLEVRGRYKSYPHTGHGHDAVFNHIPYYDAVHAAQNGIKHGKQGKDDAINMGHVLGRYVKRYISLYHVPGDKYPDKFTKPDKAISHKTQAAEQRKSDHNNLRRTNARTGFAEPRCQPFGPCRRV